MTRFDLYIYQTADKLVDVETITKDEKLNKEDIEFKIVENSFIPDLRGNYPGTIQLVGYFDNFDCVQTVRTTFSRVGSDKTNGVVLFQTNVVANHINEHFLDMDTHILISKILNSISYFNFIVNKLNSSKN